MMMNVMYWTNWPRWLTADQWTGCVAGNCTTVSSGLWRMCSRDLNIRTSLGWLDVGISSRVDGQWSFETYNLVAEWSFDWHRSFVGWCVMQQTELSHRSKWPAIDWTRMNTGNGCSLWKHKTRRRRRNAHRNKKEQEAKEGGGGDCD